MDEIRCAIELRQDETRQGPGRIVGRLITYGERAGRPRRNVRPWRPALGSEGGIILNEQHNRQAPILRFTPELDGAELRINAKLPDTQRGRDAATMIRERHHDGAQYRVPRRERGPGVRGPGGPPRGPGGRGACRLAELQDDGRGPRQGCARTGDRDAMAVEITVAELAAAIRVGDSAEEIGRGHAASRLLYRDRSRGAPIEDTPVAVVERPAGGIPVRSAYGVQGQLLRERHAVLWRLANGPALASFTGSRRRTRTRRTASRRLGATGRPGGSGTDRIADDHHLHGERMGRDDSAGTRNRCGWHLRRWAGRHRDRDRAFPKGGAVRPRDRRRRCDRRSRPAVLARDGGGSVLFASREAGSITRSICSRIAADAGA